MDALRSVSVKDVSSIGRNFPDVMGVFDNSKS